MNLIKVVLAFAIFSAPIFAQEIGGAKGKVRNPRGSSLADVTVTARQDDKDVKSVTTNKSGDFVLERLPAGKYSFVFSKEGFATSSMKNVEIGKNKIRTLGNNLVLDIDEGFLVIVRGSVFNQFGRSVYGAKIEISRVETDGSMRKQGSSISSQSGEFTFRFPKGAATYRVKASYGVATETKDVSVEEPALYRLALTLNIEQ